jgi:hypothetical protein
MLGTTCRRKRRRNAALARAGEIEQNFAAGQSVAIEYGGTTLKSDGTLVGRRIAAQVGLRDRARRVLQSQIEGWPEANRSEARQELNRAYDRFVGTYVSSAEEGLLVSLNQKGAVDLPFICSLYGNRFNSATAVRPWKHHRRTDYLQ